METTQQPHKTKTEIAAELRVLGLSYTEIGERMKCTRQAANALCRRYERRKKKLEARQVYWASSLSVRTQNVLINLGIENYDEAVAMFPKLWPWERNGFISPRNFGRNSYNELAKFLGFDVYIPPKRLCPHCGNGIHA